MNVHDIGLYECQDYIVPLEKVVLIEQTNSNDFKVHLINNMEILLNAADGSDLILRLRQFNELKYLGGTVEVNNNTV